jgi:hypothetical protein
VNWRIFPQTLPDSSVKNPKVRRAWYGSWGYAESFVIASAVTAGGLVAQWVAGPRPESFPAWPVNLVILAFLVLFSVMARPLRQRKPYRFLTSIPLSTVLTGFICFFALMMGLIPQISSGPVPDNVLGRLGFFRITSSWYFSFLYLIVLLSLGSTIFLRFSPRRMVFFLNHAGLWLVLIASGLGAVDRQREIVRVPEGGVEWRSVAAAPDGGKMNFKELDLAIRLDDFVMEQYPARLALVDNLTGESWPPGSRLLTFQIDPERPKGRLSGFDIELIDFLPQAAPSGEGSFMRSMFRGQVQAALVLVTDRLTSKTFQGWVSTSGSFLPPKPLSLGDFSDQAAHGPVLVMTNPEPKLFLSKIKVFTQKGEEIESTVSVNHPLRAGDWLIYQRDYDVSAGTESSWSGFELVKDPWLKLAYLGFIIWAAGCLGLVIKAGPGKS